MRSRSNLIKKKKKRLLTIHEEADGGGDMELKASVNLLGADHYKRHEANQCAQCTILINNANSCANQEVSSSLSDQSNRGHLRPSSRLLWSHWVSPLMKRWLPILQVFLISQILLLASKETNCDQGDFFRAQQPIFDVMPDLDDYQQLSSQQKSFEYQTNPQQQHQQEPSSTLFNQMATFDEVDQNSHGAEKEKNGEQQNLIIDELLDSQSSATQAASTAPVASGTTADTSKPSTGTTLTSTASQTNPESPTLATSGSSGPSLSEQLSVLTSLLQHIGPSGQSNQQPSSPSLSDSIISGVTNNILEPIRAQTNAMGNMVRKTMNAAAAANNNQQTASMGLLEATSGRPHVMSAQSQSQRPNSVGQSINGNIEYDSENNSINGNIEWPSFNTSNKFSSIKPFLVAALKTVPIKLGSVGWKLLQLIAWKKIYKTHHPKSGEIVIEQEMDTGKSAGGHSHAGKSAGITKNVQLEISAKPVLKTSKMGQAWPMGGGGGGGGFSSGGWPYSSGSHSAWPLLDGPMSAHSMVYQRHLLPPNPSATAAAAAAAAATAAAIQSQWVQNQLVNENELPDSYGQHKAASSTQSSNSTSGSSSQTGSGGHLPAATQRKRSSPTAPGGNWFASPAQAYAAAAAAAATASAVSQHSLNPMSRLESTISNQHRPHPFESAVSHDGSFLAGLVYQNLFDNAAAMAVQNAVKLPHAGGPSPTSFASSFNNLNNNNQDYLEQADSLPGSSLTLGSSSFGTGASGADVDAWQLTESSPGAFASDRSDVGFGLSSHRFANQLMVNHQADSLLALQDPASGPPSPGSLADFDDTPAARMLQAAANGTGGLQPHHFRGYPAEMATLSRRVSG